ncbi:hypothetical protein [Photorhabdus luminescens]|uniref:hypothetical protein n=1 Tax=Photorhabdus luminescens TaxID=29488 RepID=UPI003D2B97B3
MIPTISAKSLLCLFATDLSAFERGISASGEGEGLSCIQRSFVMADAVATFTAFAVWCWRGYSGQR